jgi:hypothetical protein
MQIKPMAKRIAAMLALLAGLIVSSAEAGFRSPESRVRNVYAYYSNGNSELSQGLPRDTETAEKFFDSLAAVSRATSKLDYGRTA